MTLVPEASQARRQVRADRVGDGTEDDRNALGRGHQRLGRGGGDADDHVGLVADELAGDLRGGAGIALGALVLPLEVLAVFVAGLLEGFLDPVAGGIQRRVLDDGGHGDRLLLVGVGAEGQGHAKGQDTEGQPFILIGLHHAAIS